MVNPDEKNQTTIKGANGEDINLFIAKDFSWDGKESNPTNGVLLHEYQGRPAGTKIVFNHRATEQHSLLPIEGYSYPVYSMEEFFLYFSIDSNGELEPFDGFLLATRIWEEVPISSSGLVLSVDQLQINNRLKVIRPARDIDDVKSGDIVVVYTYSDYEANFNLNGKDTRVIKLAYSDILAIDESDLVYSEEKISFI